MLLLTCLVLASAGCQAVVEADASAEVRVAVIPPGFTSPFHVAIKEGAVAAAGDKGWQVDVVAAEREGDFAGQVAVVEQELQKGVSAIAVNPIDARAIVTAVNSANDLNIPIFMHNTITPVGEGEITEYIGYDQWSGAAKLGQYTCGMLNGKGKVFILMGIPGFHANRRTQGYVWALEKWCPDVIVVGQQTAEWEREKAFNIASAALQQHPEIDLFFGNSDEMGIGACLAAESMGRTINKDIWCIAIDGNDVTLDLIQEGKMTATLGVYPQKMGAIVIEQMAKVLNGQEVPYILEMPSTIVDRTNLDAYRSGNTWVPPRKGTPEQDNGEPSGVFSNW